jgi:glutamate formiminotransferase/formiminotetrahydrofolate cyclodeaminase
MKEPIVECIANYSEARNPEIITKIAEAITDVVGVYLLDQHSDLDHNRTVLTFVGSPDAIEEAAFKSIAKAAQFINLDEHEGEHPRIGATDVVPFVPISEVSMQDCVQIANRLGKRVGEELDIPVYLYEEAATRPERKNLEYIRRGQYEAIKTEITTNPEREPDFGPQRVGLAGATVIGARQPLIAFNVYLTTDDKSIADNIARAVRFSSGGMRFVKALGMLVEGRAQVSMNLTNYRKTPVERVVESIRCEATRYGVAIHHSELVGLIPQEALTNAAEWYMQLDEFETDQILEQRLYSAHEQARASSVKIDTGANFLDALAADTPTPGGGSASAYSAAAAAALVAMVTRVTIGKKKYAQVEPQMQSILEKAEILRSELTSAVEHDAKAFENVMSAYRLPKDTDEQKEKRAIEIEQATLGATNVPLKVARMAVKTLELAAQVVKSGNINAISDGGTAAALARGALTSAGFNVRINSNSLSDRVTSQQFLDELEALEARADDLEKDVYSVLRERGNLV